MKFIIWTLVWFGLFEIGAWRESLFGTYEKPSTTLSFLVIILWIGLYYLIIREER